MDEKNNTALDHLFDTNITGALDIKIENEMEIPLNDEREFIQEETIEDEGSDFDELNEVHLKEESEGSRSFDEEEEYISDDLEKKVKKKKRGRKSDEIGDDELFE